MRARRLKRCGTCSLQSPDKLQLPSGRFSWRYRNLFQAQRTLSFRSYHPAPYVSAEFFYESQYSKWSDTALYAGCLFPIGNHIEFDPYYEHQNKHGQEPQSTIEPVGDHTQSLLLAQVVGFDHPTYCGVGEWCRLRSSSSCARGTVTLKRCAHNRVWV